MGAGGCGSLLLTQLLAAGDGVLLGATFGLGGRLQAAALQHLPTPAGQESHHSVSELSGV